MKQLSFGCFGFTCLSSSNLALYLLFQSGKSCLVNTKGGPKGTGESLVLFLGEKEHDIVYFQVSY